jgi:hypothetical protein
MHARFEQVLQSELTRLRLIERVLHEPRTIFQVQVAGHTAPLAIFFVDEILNISAEIPAFCPTEDVVMAYILADGVPVYTVALPDEVHHGKPTIFNLTWMVPDLVRDGS